MSSDDIPTQRATRPLLERTTRRRLMVGLTALLAVLAVAGVANHHRRQRLLAQRALDIAAGLASTDPRIRADAVESARTFPGGLPHGVAPGLLSAARNAHNAGHRAVAMTARRLLLELPPDVLAPILVDGLAGSDAMPFAMLVTLGAAARPHLEAGLQHRDGWARARSAVVLAELGIALTDAQVAAMQADPDRRVRYAVLECFRTRNDFGPRAQAALLAAIETDDHVEVRSFACGVLAHFKSRATAAIPTLRAVAEDFAETPRMRVAAMMAIVDIQPEVAAELADHGILTGEIATGMLRIQGGTRGSTILEGILTDSDRTLRARAAALEALIDGGHDLADRWLPHVAGDQRLLLHAAKLLGRPDVVDLTAEVRDMLRARVGRGHPLVQLAAARALVRDRYRDRDRLPKLVATLAMTVPDPDRGGLAQSTLLALAASHKGPLPRLRHLTHDDDARRRALLELAANIHGLLGEIGDQREVLEQLVPLWQKAGQTALAAQARKRIAALRATTSPPGDGSE